VITWDTWYVLEARAQAKVCTVLWMLTCLLEWRSNLDPTGVHFQLGNARANTYTLALMAWCFDALWKTDSSVDRRTAYDTVRTVVTCYITAECAGVYPA
jgi:hypothetical protein